MTSDKTTQESDNSNGNTLPYLIRSRRIQVKESNVVIDKSGVLEEGAIISDQSMMIKLKALADSIDPSLKATTDVGSNHEDGRLPILDLFFFFIMNY